MSLPSIAPLIFSVHCTIYILWKTSNCTRQHCLLNTSSRFQQLYNVDHLQSGLSRVRANFAELQKGCKIVLARRSAPYLRVVTNDKYCTSCHSSCKRSPKPDQRLYSTTARVCLTVPHTSHRSFVLHIHRFKLLHLNVVETLQRSVGPGSDLSRLASFFLIALWGS